MKSLTLHLLVLSILSKNSAQNLNEEKVSYRGFQMWNVDLNNESDLEYFKALQTNHSISLLHGNSTTIDLLVDPHNIQNLKKDLDSRNVTVKIRIADVQQLIDEQPDPTNSQLELEDRKGHRLTWRAYHPLTDIYGYLHYLADTFPNLIKIQTIGRSIENRPIKLLRISNGNVNNSAIWIDAGIHAREWISPASATYIIERIVSNYDYESESMRGIDWYIVPVLNPDGYEFSYNVDRFWRKNRRKVSQECAGIDLNRNFGYQWDGYGSSADPCTNQYRGKSPFSEPETASVARFFLDNKNKIHWKGFVSIHSYGQYILYPWGSATTFGLADQNELDQVGRLAAKAILSAGGEEYTVGEIKSTLYQTAGTSTDWARGAESIKYAYTIELRDTGRFGFLLPAQYIKDTSEEAMIFVRTIAKASAVNPL